MNLAAREGTYTPNTPSGFNMGATGSKQGYYKVIPSLRMIYFRAVYQFNGAGSVIPAGPTTLIDLPPGFPAADFFSCDGYLDWGLRGLWGRGTPSGSQVQVRTSDNAAMTSGFAPSFSHMAVNGWYPY